MKVSRALRCSLFALGLACGAAPSLSQRAAVEPAAAQTLGDAARLLQEAESESEVGRLPQALVKTQAAVAIHERLDPEGPKLAASLMRQGQVIMWLNRPQDGLPLLERALALSIRHHRLDSVESLRVLDVLAQTHELARDYDRALALLQQCVAISEKVHGPEAAATGERVGALARFYASGHWERSEQAETAYRRALAISRKNHGDEHWNTAAYMIAVGRMLHRQMRYEEARTLMEPALEIARKTLGPRHGGLVSYLNMLAAVNRDLGRLDETERLAAEAVAIAGPNLMVAGLDKSLSHLAAIKQARAAYAEAEALLLRAIEVAEKQFGRESTALSNHLSDLGSLYQAMGQFAKGEAAYLRVVAIRERAHGPDGPMVGDALHALAGFYAAMSEYSKAEAAYLRALQIAEAQDGPEHLSTAATLDRLADVYLSLEDYGRAEPLARRALAIAEKNLGPVHPTTGNYLYSLGLTYGAMGRPGAALALLERALPIYEKERHDLVADLLGSLAEQELALGHYGRAESLAGRAVALSAGTPAEDNAATSEQLVGLGAVYQAMDRPADAESAYRRALAIAEKVFGPAHPTTAYRTKVLGDLYALTGRYSEALRSFQRTLAILEKAYGAGHSEIGASLNNIGLLYESMGQYDKAIEALTRALALAEQTLGHAHSETSLRMGNLARQYRALGDYGRAEALLREATARNEAAFGKEHWQTGYRYAHLAETYRLTGRLDEAERLYRRALAIAEADPAALPAAVGMRRNGLAKLYLAAGRHHEAERLARQALEAAGRSVPVERFEANATLARIEKARPEGNAALAIYYGKQAVNVFQGVRGHARGLDADSQRMLLRSRQGIYEELAAWLIEAGRLPEAQQILAMLKEQEYHDFSRRDAAADARSTAAAFTGPERTWAQRQSQLDGQVLALAQEADQLALKARTGGTLTEAELARRTQLRGQLDAARREVEALILQIAKEAAANARSDEEKAAIGERGLANLRALQTTLGKLGQGAVLIHTVTGRDRLSLILTTPQAQVARQVPVKEGELNQAIAQLRQALESPYLDPRPAAARLHGWLVAPLQAELAAAGARTLMFSLDGALRYVPMAALHDGKQYLAEQYAIALYTEAARDKLQERPAVQDWSITGLGVTTAQPGFPGLPAVEAELKAIVRTSASPNGALPGAAFLNEAFTEDRLRDALESRQPVLHIASHFQFGPGTDADSFLLLGDGSRFTLAQMRSLQFPLELLTLSACQTALGDRGSRDADGREVEGFAVLAQRQGAAAVLATLWSVADASTGPFMQELYRLKAREPGLSKAEALRRVQQGFIAGRLGASAMGQARGATVRARPPAEGSNAAARYTPDPQAPFAHPFFWAPFVLMGNWL